MVVYVSCLSSLWICIALPCITGTDQVLALRYCSSKSNEGKSIFNTYTGTVTYVGPDSSHFFGNQKMAGQNYLPRHIERTHEQSRSNPISDSHLQFGHNPMPPRSDLRLDVPPPPVPYPNQYMRSNSRQTSIAPINHPTIMPRSNRDHASSSSSFNLHPEYPSYYPTVHHTSNESSSSYFSLNYSEAGPSYPPPHVPRDVTDNRRTVLKRKHHDVPVDPIHTEYWPSESGTSGVAHNWVTDLAEGSQRNVRIRQGYYSPLELNPPRHYVPSTVTPQHYSVQSNPHGLRGPEHANYSVHVAAQDRNIPDPGRFNNDPSSVHHGGNHIANHRTIVRCEPNYYAQNRSSTLPVTSHQGNIARAVGHVNTSFPHIADHHGPTPAYATASASARWRQGFSEFEASSSLSRPISFSDSSMGSTGPRNSDPGLRTSFHVDHNAGRWLFEHFVSPEDPLLFNSRELFDEHRDMRLDIDDMSYEELLDLEERIGYVSTGLPGDRILKCLKETTYRTCNESQGDSCVICMEEYEKGDKVGTLNCAHNFHTTCIKKWLERKNICPVCKSEAFEVSSQK